MDRIDLLETKVKQMIEMVQVLRDENRDLTERLQAAEGRLKEASEERGVLDRERDEVRGRIEQLLGELEGIGKAPPTGEGDPAGDPAGADAGRGNGGGRGARHRAENPVLPGIS